MRKNSFFPAACIAVAIAGLVWTGCSKDDMTPSPASTSTGNADLRTMNDNNTGEASFDDMGDVANEGIYGANDDGNRITTSCASISLNLNVMPHTATIDYGPTDCLGHDGNYRRGKIIVTWTGDYRQSGTVITITTENYFLNFNKIDGSKTITNNGLNDSGNLTFGIVVNGTITVDPQYSSTNTGGVMTYSATKTKEWIRGKHSLRWDDDVYLISGTAQGTNTANVTYTATTDGSAPLRREVGFPHFTSGIITVTKSAPEVSTFPLTIDYSYINGNRDDLARVTSEGKTYTIHLGMKVH